jgi:ribosomal protein L15
MAASHNESSAISMVWVKGFANPRGDLRVEAEVNQVQLEVRGPKLRDNRPRTAPAHRFRVGRQPKWQTVKVIGKGDLTPQAPQHLK